MQYGSITGYSVRYPQWVPRVLLELFYGTHQQYTLNCSAYRKGRNRKQESPEETHVGIYETRIRKRYRRKREWEMK